MIFAKRDEGFAHVISAANAAAIGALHVARYGELRAASCLLLARKVRLKMIQVKIHRPPIVVVAARVFA